MEWKPGTERREVPETASWEAEKQQGAIQERDFLENRQIGALGENKDDFILYAKTSKKRSIQVFIDVIFNN